ncbi:anthranilate synthase component I [Sandaracinobacteroides hominis]|uniref:anthranilate synthase component I n=1 Tax=Sandaracinobacteroides hominis TaxID=2780086 RepID=UPI0018F3EE58|nr:anthranilate synthase component I [Sandaracinobacteroides hominis]
MRDADDRATACSKLAAGQHACLHIVLDADTETPVSAWMKLAKEGRGDFLLESVEGGRTRGRYSLIGLDPDLAFRAEGNRAEINSRWRSDPAAFVAVEAPTLDALRQLVGSIRMEVPASLPPALPFLVGYFGYETASLVEKLPVPDANPLSVPDMFFVRPGLLLVFDRLADTLMVIAPIYADAEKDPQRLVEAATERLETAAARLAQPLPARATVADVAVEAAPIPAVAPERYREMVGRAKDYIAAGDIFQVVLAQRFQLPFPLPPFQLYRSLRRVNPSPFLYHLDFPGFAVIGSSPEILVRARDGQITIRPIAGTRPRGKTDAEDEANRESLLADPKELAEHLMLLDLGRNDVGRVAEAGSVQVTERFTIERYSHVMHIVSNVIGRQRQGSDSIDAILAGFPAGTVSGAPKVRAMEIIAELESERRGPYAGGVGYFAPDGGMDSCIILRTAVVKDGVMHVTAGAGIVADSDPASEQRECEAKAGALMAAAKLALAAAGEPQFGQ